MDIKDQHIYIYISYVKKTQETLCVWWNKLFDYLTLEMIFLLTGFPCQKQFKLFVGWVRAPFFPPGASILYPKKGAREPNPKKSLKFRHSMR